MYYRRRSNYRKYRKPRRRYNKRYMRRYRKRTYHERKFYDVTASALSVTNLGSFIGLCAPIVKGTDGNQRIGDSIAVRSIQLRYIIDAKQGAPETDPFYNRVRLLLVQDRQSNGASSAGSNLLEDTTNPIVSPLESDYFRRFKVLHDAVISLDYDDPSFSGRFYKKMNIPVRYSPDGAIPTSNNIIAFVISDQADDYPVMNYWFRVRYDDI